MLNLIAITNKYLSPVWKEKPFGKWKRTTTKLKYMEMMIPQIESEPVRSPMRPSGFESEGILPSPCSFFKLFHAPSLSFLAGFLSSLTVRQLSHCLSPLPTQAWRHFLQKELHCLQANQVSELLLDATSSWTQNCTSSNTSLPLYRLVCKEFSEVSILHKARPSVITWLILRELDSWLWGLLDNAFLLLGTASAQW